MFSPWSRWRRQRARLAAISGQHPAGLGGRLLNEPASAADDELASEPADPGRGRHYNPVIANDGELNGAERLKLGKQFIIDPDFAQRFNAYATACFPNEIGAVVRIIERPGELVAIDFAVLPQEVSPTYFEFTTSGQAEFQMSLATSGRGEQLAEWYGLIHSHPNMTPFMSGTDVDNLWKLAGNKRGFSLICSAHRQPENNYFSVNYAQGGEWPLMIKRLPHNDGQDLGGTGDLSSEQLAAIAAEVAEKTTPRHAGWYGSEYRPGPKVNYYSAGPDSAEQRTAVGQQEPLPGLWFTSADDHEDRDSGANDLSVDDLGADDQELFFIPALSEPAAEEIVTAALRLAEDLGIGQSGEIAEIERKIALEEALCYQHVDLLLSALGEYPYTEDNDEERLVQELIDRLSAEIDTYLPDWEE